MLGTSKLTRGAALGLTSLVALSSGARAQDAEIDFFDLVGNIRIGTCGADADTTELWPISSSTASGPRFTFRDSTDFNTVGQTLILNRDDTSTAEVNDAAYRLPLARTNPNGPITYQSFNRARNERRAEFFYCPRDVAPTNCSGSTRSLRQRLTEFVAPASASSLTYDVSLRRPVAVFRLVTQAPLPGEAPDVIDSVSLQITSDGGNPPNAGFNSSTSVVGPGCALDADCAPGSLCRETSFGTSAMRCVAQDPTTVNGFTRVVDTSTGTQVVTAAFLFPLVQGTNYTLSGNVQFSDGLTTTITPQVINAADVGECDTLTFDFQVIRPPQTIQGISHFRRDPAEPMTSGPVATRYSFDYGLLDDSGTGVQRNLGWTSGGTQILRPPDGDLLGGPHTYALRGAPVGRYRLTVNATDLTTGAGRRQFGHAELAWLDAGWVDPRQTHSNFPVGSREREAWFALSIAELIFRFPRLTPTMSPIDLQSDQTSGFDLDGHFYVSANETETLDRVADMAFATGQLNLLGCVDNSHITAGTHEVEGMSAGGATEFFVDETGTQRQVHSGTVGGFARGLFTPVPGRWELVASVGPWEEGKYRIKLDRPVDATNDTTYDGTLTIFPSPAERDTYDLLPGRANTFEAPANTYATGRARVIMTVRDPQSGAPTAFRRPRLTIGADTNDERPFTAPDGALLGHYTATSTGSDELLLAHTIEIYGVANSTVVVQPSALVPGPDGEARVPGQSFTVTFDGTCDGGCLVDGVPFADDGNAPVITSAPSILSLESDASSATFTFTVTDAIALFSVTVDGVAATQTSATGYTVTIPVSPGQSSVTLVATDMCRRTRTLSIPVEFAPDLCAVPLYEQCTAASTGSVFHVAVTNGTSNCHIVCETGADGQTLSCDPNPVCP